MMTEYIIDIGLVECWEKNCENIEFTTAHASDMHALHIIVQENDDQQIKKNIRLKFPEFSLSFAKFLNSPSFPCREFLFAILPVSLFRGYPVISMLCAVLPILHQCAVSSFTLKKHNGCLLHIYPDLSLFGPVSPPSLMHGD